MNADARWLWARLNTNYWFYPALFSIASAALAFLLVWLDRNGLSEELNRVGWLIPARPGGASNMLTVIAGSMIGIASTVFSITIAAVAYASGAYGPRLLTNFMSDKGNQLSLATFIGTFVYAITVLRSVRAEDEAAASLEEAVATALPGFVPQAALLVAYALMAVSVAVLVYFLNHVPSSIRINTVLKGIGRRLLADIEQNYPEHPDGPEEADMRMEHKLLARRTGYIQIIDFEELDRLAADRRCALALRVRTGDFIHRGMAIAEVDAAPGDDVAAAFDHAFTIGSTRTPTQDPQFLIDELVEIGLRALSPGINDPFTAITAIHWLGAATAELARRDLRRRHEDHPDAGTVYPLPDTFAHFADRGFGVLRSAVATSLPATLVTFDTLRHAICSIPCAPRREELRRQAERLISHARITLKGPDLVEAERRYAEFVEATV